MISIFGFAEGSWHRSGVHFKINRWPYAYDKNQQTRRGDKRQTCGRWCADFGVNLLDAKRRLIDFVCDIGETKPDVDYRFYLTFSAKRGVWFNEKSNLLPIFGWLKALRTVWAFRTSWIQNVASRASSIKSDYDGTDQVEKRAWCIIDDGKIH